MARKSAERSSATVAPSERIVVAVNNVGGGPRWDIVIVESERRECERGQARWKFHPSRAVVARVAGAKNFTSAIAEKKRQSSYRHRSLKFADIGFAK